MNTRSTKATDLILGIGDLPLPVEVIKFCTKTVHDVMSENITFEYRKSIIKEARVKLSYSTAVTEAFINHYCQDLEELVKHA